MAALSKIARSVLVSLCVMSAPMATSLGHELIPIGTLPKLNAEWEICVDDRPTKTEASLPFHWVVFRHKKSGDLLSFASHPPETGKKRGLEYWSDTALEIFPNGRPVWTQNDLDARRDATTTVLNIKAVSSNRREVLEYCFVSESSGRNNTMAHGRVWVCPKGIVFVQHTSTRPITPEFIQDTIVELIRGQQDVSVPKSP